MKSFIISVFILLISIETISAQVFTERITYFPGVEVDSIILLATNKSSQIHLTKHDSLTFTQKQWDDHHEMNRLMRKFFKEPLFSSNDYADYLKVYEIKQTVSTAKEIQKIMWLFPDQECASVPAYRFMPDYRDCAIFFKDGKPFSALKICFGCHAVRSTPESTSAKCLANDDTFNPILEAWIARGLYNMMERPQ